MEAAWSITDLPPAAPGILLLLLLVDLGLLGSSFFAIFNNLNTFDYEMASNRSLLQGMCHITAANQRIRKTDGISVQISPLCQTTLSSTATSQASTIFEWPFSSARVTSMKGN